MCQWNLDMQGKGMRGKLYKVDLNYHNERPKHKDRTKFKPLKVVE